MLLLHDHYYSDELLFAALGGMLDASAGGGLTVGFLAGGAPGCASSCGVVFAAILRRAVCILGTGAGFTKALSPVPPVPEPVTGFILVSNLGLGWFRVWGLELINIELRGRS